MNRFIFGSVFFFVFGISTAYAELPNPTAIVVKAKPNTSTLLASAICIVEPVSTPAGTIEVKRSSGVQSAYILLPAERRDSLKVELKTGKVAGSNCEADATLQIEVQVDSGPEISGAGVQQAFTVLMAAFVLALLLESAFELLFNWRLFQAYFVGRAWRTPIMFLVSLAIVKHFELDLLAEVFAAYHGGAEPSESWTSSVLTAMILSGGSVGVNRLLVALNFRPAIPKSEQEKKKPTSTEAYVSIEVRGIKDRKISIEMEEVINNNNTLPTLAVIASDNDSRLKNILFPSRTRFPSSGGMTLEATTKCYRFILKDLDTKQLYNIDGTVIAAPANATQFCFAPRSIVDFVVNLT